MYTMYTICAINRWTRHIAFSPILFAVAFVTAMEWSSRCVAETTVSVGVLYPEVREPYDSIFRSIIDGIRSVPGIESKDYALTSDSDLKALPGWLNGGSFDAVIALGTRGLRMSEQLPSNLPTVVGAVQMSADLTERHITGIVLSPDPDVLFARLVAVAPRVRRVNVVYNPEVNGWLISRAKKAAVVQGIRLNALPATSFREAASRFRNLLSESKQDRDTIWILQDSTIFDERSMLPSILKTAWDRRLIVISNTPTDVKRGVLLALYPNNHAMGARLGRLAIDVAGKGDHKVENSGVMPLRDLHVAINARTAKHLGLEISRHDLETYDLVFPER